MKPTRAKHTTAKKVVVGKKAPDFTLPDQEGKIHRLSDYKGKWVLVYFYPKDDTTGCTTEACTIRDSWADFKKHSIVVLGVSADSEKSHQKFKDKYKLPFTLLADTDHVLLEAYGVWGEKKFMGRTYQGIHRMSFLVSPEGNVAKIYEKVKPPIHAKEVLSDVAAFKKNI